MHLQKFTICVSLPSGHGRTMTLGELDEKDRSILTIQDQLSRLSKELYIGSDQVTISKEIVMMVPLPKTSDTSESEQLNYPGDESEFDMSLSSALSSICTMSQEFRRGLELNRRTAIVHAKELELKASKETETLATRNRERLDKMQEFLDSNMDVDLMDIRRKQDLILSALEDYGNDLDEKTDEAEVKALIQSHHDELVSHIQVALRSVKDDEVNFKACIDRIESTTGDLKNAKAERTELKELCALLFSC